MKKIIVLIVVILFTNVPMSCDQSGDDCGPFPAMLSVIKEMKVAIGKFDSNDFVEVESNKYKEAAIRVEVTKTESTEVAVLSKPFYFSLISSAYACSPKEPELSQSILSIGIISNTSVFIDGKEVKAGTSLNEFFRVLNYGGKTIEEYINLEITDIYSFGYLGSSFTLMLNKQTDQAINQKLQIKIKLSDGVVFDLETEMFKVD